MCAKLCVIVSDFLLVRALSVVVCCLRKNGFHSFFVAGIAWMPCTVLFAFAYALALCRHHLGECGGALWRVATAAG